MCAHTMCVYIGNVQTCIYVIRIDLSIELITIRVYASYALYYYIMIYLRNVRLLYFIIIIIIIVIACLCAARMVEYL